MPRIVNKYPRESCPWAWPWNPVKDGNRLELSQQWGSALIRYVGTVIWGNLDLGVLGHLLGLSVQAIIGDKNYWCLPLYMLLGNVRVELQPADPSDDPDAENKDRNELVPVPEEEAIADEARMRELFKLVTRVGDGSFLSGCLPLTHPTVLPQRQHVVMELLGLGQEREFLAVAGAEFRVWFYGDRLRDVV